MAKHPGSYTVKVVKPIGYKRSTSFSLQARGRAGPAGGVGGLPAGRGWKKRSRAAPCVTRFCPLPPNHPPPRRSSPPWRPRAWLTRRWPSWRISRTSAAPRTAPATAPRSGLTTSAQRWGGGRASTQPRAPTPRRPPVTRSRPRHGARPAPPPLLPSPPGTRERDRPGPHGEGRPLPPRAHHLHQRRPHPAAGAAGRGAGLQGQGPAALVLGPHRAADAGPGLQLPRRHRRRAGGRPRSGARPRAARDAAAAPLPSRGRCSGARGGFVARPPR